MKDNVGTLLYLVILAIILISAAIKKKKPQRKNTSTAPSGAASVFEKFITGTSISDVLLTQDEKAQEEIQKMQEEPEMKKEPEEPQEKPKKKTAYQSIQIEKNDQYDWSIEDSFLPPGHEGDSSFPQQGKPFNADISSYETIESNEKDSECNSFLEKIITDFDIRKAIVYSEIMGHKYF